MLSRLDTPGLASVSNRISRSLSVTAERIFLADNAGSSSRLISPASVDADLLIFDVGSAKS
ncbi:hypothetical protein PICSAR29_04276 [Mycobacterium avium subsp. paratuberculosis]|nr:hypothetical protein PICSAR29_04276 [Mycobacterium avium subsp. paratuberculosis]